MVHDLTSDPVFKYLTVFVENGSGICVLAKAPLTSKKVFIFKTYENSL